MGSTCGKRGCKTCFADETEMKQIIREHRNINIHQTYSKSDSGKETSEPTHNSIPLDSRAIELLTEMISIPIPESPQQQSEYKEEKEIYTIDKDVMMSADRVQRLSVILDPMELQQVLEKQYEGSPTDDDDDEELESSLDEDEITEIEIRKSETKKSPLTSSVPLLGPQLCKNATESSTWNKGEFDKLRSDMEQQLVSLQSEKERDDNEDKNKKGTLHHPENSHLFRNKSAHKWDNLTLKQTKEEMEKEMMHLLMDNSGNVAPNAYV